MHLHRGENEVLINVEVHHMIWIEPVVTVYDVALCLGQPAGRLDYFR